MMTSAQKYSITFLDNELETMAMSDAMATIAIGIFTFVSKYVNLC